MFTVAAFIDLDFLIFYGAKLAQNVIPQEFTTYFRSVIAFGAVRILEDEAEKRAAAELLAMKYAPAGSNENRAEVIRQEWPRFCMLELSVEHLTGKEAIELVQDR